MDARSVGFLRVARTLGSWSWRERLSVVEAWTLLSLCRVAVLLFPFRRVVALLRGPDAPGYPARTDRPAAGRVALAIRRATRIAPWGHNCLAQAIAGSLMLRRRGVSNTVFLGVKKEDGQMRAHAWLRMGDLVVTGGPLHTEYTPISSFGAKLP